MAESALEAAAEAHGIELARLRTLYGRQAFAVAQLRKGHVAPDGAGFTNSVRCVDAACRCTGCALFPARPGAAAHSSPRSAVLLLGDVTPCVTPCVAHSLCRSLPVPPFPALLLLCSFWVPQALLFDFFKHWVSREAALVDVEGFLGLKASELLAPRARWHACMLALIARYLASSAPRRLVSESRAPACAKAALRLTATLTVCPPCTHPHACCR